MSDIDRFSIVTLILFFISTIFVIQPISFHIYLPIFKRTRITIGLLSAPILAIAILWAAQCLGPTQIRNGIVGSDNIKPYNILILFISLAYMAITLDVTGILQAAAFWVSNKGGNNGRKLYFYFYLLITLISMVVGNDPIILSGTAFLVYYTAATKLEPVAWLISEFAAANTASMVLFVGNPTNVVICEGFRINNAGFTGYTILPFLACSVACFVALAIQFRESKHVPHKLNFTGHLNVREVLRDPVSACFGSILLLTCLIVVIVLSFLHVDVWKVTLPFAGAKFIFDMCWDHYRSTHNLIKDPDVDIMAKELQRAASFDQTTLDRAATFVSLGGAASKIQEAGGQDSANSDSPNPTLISKENPTKDDTLHKTEQPLFFYKQRQWVDEKHKILSHHFPTFFTALPRLPFGLIPFAFSQFILIEALEHQGWIEVFGRWLEIASGRQMIPTIWLVGVLGVILCNIAGTNIGATILLTKVVHATPGLPPSSIRAAAVALAVASNIGAVSFTFSASLAGLLWDTILKQKGIEMKQIRFALWNLLPLLMMTGAGLAIVTAEMVVLNK